MKKMRKVSYISKTHTKYVRVTSHTMYTELANILNQRNICD